MARRKQYNELKFMWAQVKVKFKFSTYQNNDRLYIWLDTKDCPFSDVSVNIPWYYSADLDRLKWSTKDWKPIEVEWVAVSDNFLWLFKNDWRACYEWLRESTLSDAILLTGYTGDNYYHILYIRKDKLPTK